MATDRMGLVTEERTLIHAIVKVFTHLADKNAAGV
jgi:hypothetical protein